VGGLTVTTESSTQIAAVYGCCGLLADSVASLPLRALDAPAHFVTSKERKTLPPLLENPYELISVTDWIVGAIWSLALRGNYFGQIIDRDSMGYATQIMPVSPDIVRPEIRSNGEVQWLFNGKPVKTEDVFHIRYQSMPGWLLGISPIQAMKYPFGLAHVMDHHAATVYQNGADPRGVIEAKNRLTEGAAARLASSWKAAHQGPNNANLPAVLDDEAKFNPITISPVDQQLLEARRYSAEEISGLVFRIPPHMVGLNERSTSFGRGIEQQERGFVANTLSGYLCRLERALTAQLPPKNYVNFDVSHRIRGSELERAQTVSLLSLAGQIVPDEGRGRWFDMPALPNGEGQKLYVPINTELLEKALQELKESEKHEDDPPPAPFGAVPPEAEPAKNGKGNPKQVAPVK
jgi:HK97 family phage portal protein